MKSKLILILYKTGLLFGRFLPNNIFIRSFHFFGKLLSSAFVREAKVSNAQLVFSGISTSFRNAKKIYQLSMAHCGVSVAEIILLINGIKKFGVLKAIELFNIKLKSSVPLVDLQNPKTAILALSAHLGCFELIAAYFSAHSVRLSVLGRDANYPSLSFIMRDLRSAYGVETVWREESSSSGKLLRAIKNKSTVAVLIDQDVDLANSFANFFAVPAASPIAPIKLAIKHKLKIVTAFIVRDGFLSHTIFCDEIVLESGVTTAESVLEEFNRRLELLIRKYPEQWLWWHRRWRRRPGEDYIKNPNLLKSTSNYLKWLETYHL